MDSAEEARDYDAMDHSQVNRVFVADFLSFWTGSGTVLDVGAGTAQIPIELCRRHASVNVIAIDLAEHMLRVGADNVQSAGLAGRIELKCCDAKRLPWPQDSFAAVISNSIVHHIPEPFTVLEEMVRVASPGGALFVRDLLRPENDTSVKNLVNTYAGAANDHQRRMFEDSSRAALTLTEIRALVARLDFEASSVRQTTDRHWTWAARKNS